MKKGETGETEREELEVEGFVGVLVDQHDIGEKQPPGVRVASEKQAAKRLEIVLVRSTLLTLALQPRYFSE